MAKNKIEPRNSLPPQAQPVCRDRHAETAAAQGHRGVAASKSQCADLTGPARQMCYAHLYGVSS